MQVGSKDRNELVDPIVFVLVAAAEPISGSHHKFLYLLFYFHQFPSRWRSLCVCACVRACVYTLLYQLRFFPMEIWVTFPKGVLCNSHEWCRLLLLNVSALSMESCQGSVFPLPQVLYTNSCSTQDLWRIRHGAHHTEVKDKGEMVTACMNSVLNQQPLDPKIVP